MTAALAIVALFSVATAVAILARRLKVPYTVALVLAGIMLGSGHLLEAPHLTKDLLFAAFLPGLIFEAAFAIEWESLRKNRNAVLSLALPGVVLATVVTGLVLTPLIRRLPAVDEFSLMLGFLFASLVVATDPIAVVALFKALGAPKRLHLLMEGESLLNDGTAVVVFTLVLAAEESGAFSLGGAVIDFARVCGMGILVGAAVGFGISEVVKRIDDAMIETTLTTIAAYGSFILAERFHYSGVIATVTAGLICGNYGARLGMSASTRLVVANFWEYLAFSLNSIVFLLIGFEVRVQSLLAAWGPILVAWLVVLLGRAVVTYAATALLAKTREKLPWSWSAVLTWGGLRGGLSMVLALALPRDIPHRDLLINMTFGVVLLSIVLQGSTMGFLLRKLGLVAARPPEEDEYELLRAKSSAAQRALDDLDQQVAERKLHEPLAEELRAPYQAQVKESEERLATLRLSADRLRHLEREAATRRALMAEREAIDAAAHSGSLSEQQAHQLEADVNRRLLELETAGRER